MKRPCIVLACMAQWTGHLIAQTSLARIRGTITDPNDAVIPAAEITATNEETGVAAKTRSNDVGAYSFPVPSPGRYTFTVIAQGFKNYQRSGLVLGTSEVLDLDLKMELGALTETVSGTAEAPLLESSSSTIGQFMDNRIVRELPMNARRSLNLVAMSGAAVFLSGGEQSYFSLAGGRARN